MELDDLFELSKLRVPLLNSGNYFIWSRKLELVLRGKGLWELVKGEEIVPNVDSTEWKPYDRRKDIALSTILLLVNESCIAHVIEMRDPQEVWKALR